MSVQPIRVLVVNDSPVALALLVYVIGEDPQLEVAATAMNGEEAVEAACRKRPDVIAMDIYMPRMDGLEATRQIMERCPIPIVIVTASGSYLREGAKSFHALERGALTLVGTPPGFDHPAHEQAVQTLIEALKLMAEVKVVRRWALPTAPSPFPPPPPPKEEVSEVPVRVVAIGASAGGPVAIRYLLARLPKAFPAPVLIVQHMAPGFVEAFAEWLQEATGIRVHLATQGERPLPGHAYLAPSDRHLGLAPDGRLRLSDAAPEGGVRPAVSWLFRSVATVCGPHAVGVLLSGMGADGAAELKTLRQQGGITIAQNKESALVYGMPGAAVQLGAASHELPLERIPGLLVNLATGRGHST